MKSKHVTKTRTFSDSRRRVSDETYNRCVEAALLFLKRNSSIRNRELRKVASIGYDQAIIVFNRPMLEKRLLRLGHASGTHYVLPKGKNH
jgi:hypothetical protein